MSTEVSSGSSRHSSSKFFGLIMVILTTMITLAVGGQTRAVIHLMHNGIVPAAAIAVSWAGLIGWAVTTVLYCAVLDYLQVSGEMATREIRHARRDLRKNTEWRFPVAGTWFFVNLVLTDNPECTLLLWIVVVPLAVSVAFLTSRNNKLVIEAQRKTGLKWMHETKFADWYRDLFDDFTENPAANAAIHYLCRAAGPNLASHYAILVVFSILTLAVVVPVSRAAEVLDKPPAAPQSQQTLDQRLDALLSQRTHRRTPKGDSWSGLCLRQPGVKAPEPEASGLRDLYLGAGVGVGAIEGGCTTRAVPVPKRRRLWMTFGTCRGELRSMGIATSSGEAALMMQEVAEYAAIEALAGRLTGASGRWTVGPGDFQMLYSTAGNVIMIRSRSARGSYRRGPGASCADWSSANVPYVPLQPVLGQLWLKLNEDGFTWPEESPNLSGAASQYRFRSAVSGRVVASGMCDSKGACTIERSGLKPLYAGAGDVTLDEVIDSMQTQGFPPSPSQSRKHSRGVRIK